MRLRAAIALRALVFCGVTAALIPGGVTSDDPPPELMAADGNALVPMRFIGQWLGAKVVYDPRTLGIIFTLGEHIVRLRLNSREASVDNLPILLAAPPTEIKGTTYIPLGFLSLYLGVQVDWNAEARVATVTHPVTGQKLMLQLPGSAGSSDSSPPPDPCRPAGAHPANEPERKAEVPAWLHVSASLPLPPGVHADDVFISDDGRHWALLESTDAGQRVIDERGTSSGVYRNCRGLQFAPVTGKLGYWGIGDDRKVSLVVDGQTYPTTFTRPGILLFSRDGERWAALGWEGDPCRPETRLTTVLVDRTEVGKYWDAGIPTFTSDGSNVAFLAVDKESHRLLLVRDGQPVELSSDPAIELFYAVGPNMAFQTDLAYAGDGSLFSIYHGDRGWQVMMESHIIATYRMSKFSRDSRPTATGFDIGHIVYPSSLEVAETANVAAWWARPQPNSPWVCCVSGREIIANDEVDPAEDRIVLSPDGRHVAFRFHHFEGQGAERRQVGESVCIDGKSGPKFDAVREIAFSPNSQHCVYLAERMGSAQMLYVLDGKGAGPDADEVSLFAFSPDGSHYAYAARHGDKMFLVVDGKEWRVPWDEIKCVTAADDGSVRLTAHENGNLITVEGMPRS